jgi:hypothetical protein
MLTLPVESRGDLLVVHDDAAPDRVCVTLARPRVTNRADGNTSVRLLRWIPTQASAGVGQITGARLSVDVDLTPGATDLASASLGGADVQPMPWLDAKVRLDGPQFDAIEADVAIAAGSLAAVSIDLPPSAADILAPLLQGDTVSPLQLTWTGHVLVRLPPVEVIASADVTEIRRRLDLIAPGRRVTTIRSIVDANARIEIRGGSNAALEQAMRDWALGQLLERLDKGQSLDVHAAASDVVPWPIVLAATLDDLVPPDRRGTLVETVVLDPGDAAGVPPIDVRVLADFGGRVERVDVRLAPSTGDRTLELSFSDTMARPAALHTSDFRWCRRIKMKGSALGEWSPWEELHGRTGLVIPVVTPGSLSVDVLAAGLDFAERWSSVHVVLTHTAAGAVAESWTADLTAAQTAASWVTPLPGARGPITAALTYVSRQGQTIQRAIDRVGDQLIVLDPLDGNQVRFTLLPAGTGWNDIAFAMVDMQYADGAYVVDETLELRRLSDMVEWVVPARPDGPQTACWRLHASFTDGRFTSSEWQEVPRGPLVVRIDGIRRRTVQILPIYFDTTTTKSVTVRLRSGPQTESIVCADRSQKIVTLPDGPFSWTLQWTRPDGSQSAESAPQDGDNVIVIPRDRGER